MAMLEVNDIHAYYGNIHALKGISLTVEEGEIVSLIGANGAGKTTTLRSISGLLPPRQGTITFEGEDLSQYKAHEIVYKQVAMVPEGRGIFARLSVSENLDMGAFLRRDKDAIKKDILWTIPNDYRSTISAINQGKSLSQIAPKAAVTESFGHLAELLSKGEVRQKKGRMRFFG